VPVDFLRLFVHEKSILASCAYTNEEMAAAVALLEEGRVAWKPIVSRTIPLAGILESGFVALSEAPHTAIKLLVDPAC
jgi:threonine dehydrogenase-like Zn-dependent dehydrogenase